MPDTTELYAAVESHADALRRMPESRLRRDGTAGGALELAREMAARAQSLEFPGAPVRDIPEEGVFAVGDQVAVAGHDLARAVAQHGTEADLREALELLAQRGATR